MAVRLRRQRRGRLPRQADPGLRRRRRERGRSCSSRPSAPTSGWSAPAKGDRHGNLVFNQSARNFNPLCAMSGKITIAEVEELVEPGELPPDEVHLPGVFVHRVLPLTPEQATEKRIERRTVRPRTDAARPRSRRPEMALTREEMAARAAEELSDGAYVNLGDRPADAGAQLRARRRRARAAVRERHPRGRAPTPTRVRRTRT